MKKCNIIMIICEILIFMLFALLIIVNIKLFPPVLPEDIYNMPVEKIIQYEQMIF